MIPPHSQRPLSSFLGLALTLVCAVAAAQQHSIDEPLGLQHFHGGMTQFTWAIPNEPDFVSLRKRAGVFKFRWIDKVLARHEVALGKVADRVESITMGRATYGPGMTVIRSRQLPKRFRSVSRSVDALRVRISALVEKTPCRQRQPESTRVAGRLSLLSRDQAPRP